MRNQEIAEATHALVTEIATHLDGWEYNTAKARHDSEDGRLYPTAYLSCDTGEFKGFSIRLCPDWNSPKLEIALCLEQSDHRDLYIRGTVPKIGASAKKGAAKIAADITRRLIPDMSAIVAEVHQAREQHQTYLDGKAACRAIMLASPMVQTYGREDVLRSHSEHANADIQISADGTVQIDFRSVPAALAVKIIEMVAAANKS